MTTTEFHNNIISLKERLRYFALSLTSDEESANDLLQETFLKAITYKDMFVHKTNFTAWVYTIMKNTFINNYRKANRAKTTIDNTKDLYFINSKQQSVAPPVDSEYAVNEIRNTIEKLKDEYRIPFKMYTEGHKYKEIADELELPIGTVKSRIFFARKSLMDSLKEYQYTDAA